MSVPGGDTTLHGTAVCFGDIGVLLRGPSGAGKSDLALRLIESGARLLADDRVRLVRDGERLMLSAPAELHGRLEIRGLGVVALPAAGSAPLRLVADLVADATVERLPEPSRFEYEGCAVPLISVAPFEISAAAKVRIAAHASVGRPDAGTGIDASHREEDPSRQ